MSPESKGAETPLDRQLIESLIERASDSINLAKGQITDPATDRVIDALDDVLGVLRAVLASPAPTDPLEGHADAKARADALAREFIDKFPSSRISSTTLGSWFHTAMQIGADIARVASPAPRYEQESPCHLNEAQPMAAPSTANSVDADSVSSLPVNSRTARSNQSQWLKYALGDAWWRGRHSARLFPERLASGANLSALCAEHVDRILAASPAQPQEALLNKIAEWRLRATMGRVSGYTNIGEAVSDIAKTYRVCADELQDIVRASHPETGASR